MEFLNCLSFDLETVQPVPAPFSTNADPTNNVKDGGNNQKDILFNLGNAINHIIVHLFIMNFLSSQISLDYVIHHVRWSGIRGKIIADITHFLVVERF